VAPPPRGVEHEAQGREQVGLACVFTKARNQDGLMCHGLEGQAGLMCHFREEFGWCGCGRGGVFFFNPSRHSRAVDRPALLPFVNIHIYRSLGLYTKTVQGH
jgi:hypothetical protein